MPDPQFRIQTSTLFLTYAQCPITKETLLQELHELFAISEYAIAQEHHSDGHMHLHAFLKLETKIHKRDATFADVQGYHPNITSPRSVKAVINYVMKDGHYIASDGIKELLDKKGYGQLIKEAITAEEFLAAVERHYPRDLVLGYDKLKAFVEYKYADKQPIFLSPFTSLNFVDVCPEMTDWALSQMALPKPNPMVMNTQSITYL